MLYIGTGDGGSGGDPSGNAQNLNTLLGKILRIDPRAAPAAAVHDPGRQPVRRRPRRDLGYGLRNPWRFSFDRHDRRPADRRRRPGPVRGGRLSRRSPDAGRGVNFGWDCCEGFSVVPDAGRRPCAGATGAHRSDLRSTTAVTAAARSPAATSSATRASATSTAATCSATSATATIRSLRARACRRRASGAVRGPRRSSQPVELRRGRLRADSTSPRWAPATSRGSTATAAGAVPLRAAAVGGPGAALRRRARRRGRSAPTARSRARPATT